MQCAVHEKRLAPLRSGGKRKVGRGGQDRTASYSGQSRTHSHFATPRRYGGCLWYRSRLSGASTQRFHLISLTAILYQDRRRTFNVGWTAVSSFDGPELGVLAES